MDLNLQEYGAEFDISVKDNDPRKILVRIVDRTRQIPKTISDANGYFSTIYVAPTYDRVVYKKNGIPVGGRLSEAYLIFEHPESGLKVYFYDTLDTKQNEYALLVVPPEQETAPENRQAKPVYDFGTPQEAITALTAPLAIARLDIHDRQINSWYKRLIYWCWQARLQGASLEFLLRSGFKGNGTDNARTDLATTMILRALSIAEERQWMTRDNLASMRDGKSGRVLRNDGVFEELEVDHIVPIELHPEFANELANLQLLPESENAAKGAKMTPEAEELLEHLLRLPPSQFVPITQPANVPAATVQSSSRGPQLHEPATYPGWSVIGETLLYQGTPLTDQLSRDAASLGLDRELFIQERVWAEKQRMFGANRTDEYELLKQSRLRQRTAPEKAAVEQLRARVLR